MKNLGFIAEVSPDEWTWPKVFAYVGIGFVIVLGLWVWTKWVEKM